ncbi:PH domain-containing protein [Streptomyces sp. MUM 178J]|uniref:PH domain-containing protein n=1 Tax=Streptomyces sp. MUM 178J TaxID=2791991 RepID=UPI001F045A8A|nr:PH domain-containing protein [Streptomyces sp. MUM 178J]WRQ78852.1 PH domain-containing protein [Streptomyces sp. MUM 178J]
MNAPAPDAGGHGAPAPAPTPVPGPAPRSGAGCGPAPHGDGWRRLDPRTVWVTGLVMTGVAGGAALPVFFGLAGVLPLWQAAALVLAGGVLVVAAAVAADYVRWRRTRYRIGPERAELHTGLLLIKRRSLARERIRSVDLTANVLQRVFGLVKVRIGTGEQTGTGESTLELDPVPKAEGERLRRELIAGAPCAESAEHHRDGLLAALDPGWIRYAPVSFVAPVLGGAAVGAVMQVSEWFGLQGEVVEWTRDRFRTTPVALTVAVLALAALVAGVVGALAFWVEMWWGYRLEREPGGALRVRRGLLTSRSISIEERRLRGVDLVEPLGVRLFGAGRLDAVATGLVREDDHKHAGHQALLPAVPAATAHEVAARVLKESSTPTGTPLTVHPPAARTRRLRRALTGVLAPAALFAALGVRVDPVLLSVAAGWTAVGVPLAALLARDAYRNLGHGLSGAYLVARSGTMRRSTVALQRSGVIGWTVRQSYFQRRAGLITLTATTAAGAGGYDVHDADESEGLCFAAAATPGVLDPFLRPAQEKEPG